MSIGVKRNQYGGSGELNFSNVFNGTDGLNENLTQTGFNISGTPKVLQITANSSGGSIIGIDFTDYKTMVVEAQPYGQALQYRIPNVVNYTSIIAAGGRYTASVDITSVTGVHPLELVMAIQGVSNYCNIFSIVLSK